MHRNTAAESGIVFDANVSTQHDSIGHNHAILDDTIVGDVGIGHEVAVMSDSGRTFVFFCAAVHGYAFAEYIAVPDDDLCGGALVREILGFTTDHAAWEKSIVSTD